MKLIDYIKINGLCKSKSGHWFNFIEFTDGEYPIRGTLSINGDEYEYQWTEDGVPCNLPYTHGLDLMPVIQEVSYKMVSKNILAECDTMYEFLCATTKS